MRKLYSICSVLFILSASYAQNSKVLAGYDVNKKRLLIQFSTLYLYNSNQGAIDADSAAVITCKVYKLPLALSYDQGYNDGTYLIGSDLIEQGKINSAKQLLSKSKGIAKVKLALQLGSFYLFRPGKKPSDLHNALFYTKQALKYSNELKIEKWQHQSLMLLGKYYVQANNLDASKKCFITVTNECRQKNDTAALAEALENQAVNLPDTDPEKEKLLKEVISLYKQLDFKEKVIETNLNLNTIYFWGGQFDLSKKILYQTLVDMRKIGFVHEQFSESALAYLESLTFNRNAALYYALKSIRRMETTKDYSFSDIFYFRLAETYLDMGHYEEAIFLLKKCIKSGPQNVNTGIWYKSFVAAVNALSLNGKNNEAINFTKSIAASYPPTQLFDKMYFAKTRARLHSTAKNYTLAEKYYNEMDLYAKELRSSETYYDIQNAYSAAALFFAKRHQVNKAKIYTDKIIANSKTYNKTYVSTDFESSLFLIDSIKGDYYGALKHFQAFKKIGDSTVNFAKNKQIEELRIQYETANKEQRINLLNRQTNLQKVALEKSNLLINLSVGTLFLLLTIIGLLYNSYRVKRKNNLILEQKEREINLVNENLRHLLDEKEWLVREVHHRVKNNLQTVISLLSSQSVYLDNDVALSAIKISKNRIHAMSLIHQKLYNSDNISTINMQNYISELVEYLKASFSLGQKLRFETKVEPLELDVAQAVPIGLILNEAITNSIKYAFPDDGKGTISVTLEKTLQDKYLLTISDNGIGFDITADQNKINSFGMSLIKGLSGDLKANFSIENKNGTIIKIEFLQEFAKKINFKVL